MESLLIVDDSEDIRKQMKWGLGKEYSVLLASDRKEGLDLFRSRHPKAVILDLGLPPDQDGTEEGFLCLKEMLREGPFTKVIVVTGRGQRENALKAIQMGAYDFYQKPVDLLELRVMIQRALHLYSIEEENSRLQSTLVGKAGDMGSIIGQCPAIISVFATMRKVASTDVPVLITGESGTGKEVVARAIHSMSLRKEGPFVPINCGAIPENLLESELFGFEKGAFTGAHAQVHGKVEYADKGTLFLDEIAELPPSLQVKLLRFLQEKTIQRVGGRENIAVDSRIIAATNADIAESIREEKFREDLYYRISVVTIHLPPLRERGDDVLLLAHFFLRKFGEVVKKRAKGFSAQSMELLRSYSWPGNIRELENRIQGALIMSDSSTISPHDLGFEGKAGVTAIVAAGTSLKDVRDRVERDLVLKTMEEQKGNMSKIAEALGISRPTLYDLMKKHGLSSRSFQSSSDDA